MITLFWVLLLGIEPIAAGLIASYATEPLNRVTEWSLSGLQWFGIIYGILAVLTLLVKAGAKGGDFDFGDFGGFGD